MLKFIILLFLLFLYIRKDKYEGIDNINGSGENDSGEIDNLEAQVKLDSKIFNYLIGGGIGFFLGLSAGIAYHVIHTYDDDSSSSS